MIFDEIKNIKNYSLIDTEIADFILSLSPDVPNGKIYLSENKLSYANVEEYTTKNHINCKPEAHRKYIDIQLLLDGIEELDYTDLSGLTVSEPYDASRDIMFFEKPDRVLNKVVLEPGKFAFINPNEAHQPQMAYNNLPSKVKKVVVKIPIKD